MVYRPGNLQETCNSWRMVKKEVKWAIQYRVNIKSYIIVIYSNIINPKTIEIAATSFFKVGATLDSTMSFYKWKSFLFMNFVTTTQECQHSPLSQIKKKILRRI